MWLESTRIHHFHGPADRKSSDRLCSDDLYEKPLMKMLRQKQPIHMCSFPFPKSLVREVTPATWGHGNKGMEVARILKKRKHGATFSTYIMSGRRHFFWVGSVEFFVHTAVTYLGSVSLRKAYPSGQSEAIQMDPSYLTIFMCFLLHI